MPHVLQKRQSWTPALPDILKVRWIMHNLLSFISIILTLKNRFGFLFPLSYFFRKLLPIPNKIIQGHHIPALY